MRSPGLRIIRRVLKPAVHLLALLPFGLLLWGFYNNTLGVNPVESMTFTTGDWGFRLLLITLSVTPLAKITASPWLVHFRRMLGLYCFFYALMHFSIYLVFDLSLDFAFLVEDIVERPYITVGFSCFVVLSSLAVTSPMGIRRKMKDKWQKLHRLVYLAGTPEVRARSEQTLVCVDMESFRPTSIPGRCRDAFESILAPISETP